MFRSILIIGALVGACSSPDTTGQQKEGWDDQCYSTSTPLVDDTYCGNEIHFWCKDGTNDYYAAPALASNYLGTICYRDTITDTSPVETQTWVYVCVIDENNVAQVRCSK